MSVPTQDILVCLCPFFPKFPFSVRLFLRFVFWNQYFEIPDLSPNHLSSNLYFLYRLAFFCKEKCQVSALWPILPPCIASFKNVSVLFSAPDVGLYCTLLCRLFLSGFPRSELRTLWHSRSYECAISQATWHREIALNSLNPLKLRGPYTQQSILELQHW